MSLAAVAWTMLSVSFAMAGTLCTTVWLGRKLKWARRTHRKNRDRILTFHIASASIFVALHPVQVLLVGYLPDVPVPGLLLQVHVIGICLGVTLLFFAVVAGATTLLFSVKPIGRRAHIWHHNFAYAIAWVYPVPMTLGLILLYLVWESGSW